MTPTEHPPKPPHSTGIFAALRALPAVRPLGVPFRVLGARGSAALAAVLPALAVVAGLLVSAPSSALAAQAHGYSSGFGGCPEPQKSKGECSAAGQLSLASNSGVAVNTEGDVYVADTGNRRVDEFEANGTFVRAFGKDVNKTKDVGLPTTKKEEEERDVCDPQTELAVECQAGSPGSEPGELEAPTFVAVDNSLGESHGDVYVAVAGESAEPPTKNLVSKFTAEGKLVETWGVKGQLNEPEGKPENQFGRPLGIAVENTGTLWLYVGGTVKDPGAHVYEFGQEGTFKEIGPTADNSGPSPQGIALDSSGALYVSEGGSAVEKLPPSKRVFAGTVTGLAIAPVSNELYVDTAGSSIADISAQCVPSEKGCAPVQVFGAPKLSGAAGLAVNAEGVVYAANTGVDEVAVLPIVLEVNPTPGSASPVTATSATLNGEVNPKGSLVSECYFEYASEAEYSAHTVACEQGLGNKPGEIGEGTSPVPVHAKIAGLRGGTLYHYRLLVKKGATTLPGNGEVFSTATVPVVSGAESRELTLTSPGAGVSGELRASVNPEGVPLTRCAFEYGTAEEYEATEKYGQLAKCEPAVAQIGAGSEPVPVSARLSELHPDTTYRWRLSVRDTTPGEAYEPGHTFIYDTTGAQLPDGRAYEMVTPVHKNGAVIGGAIGAAPVEISGEGSRVIAASSQCFADAGSCTALAGGTPYAFERTPTGWVTSSLAPPGVQQFFGSFADANTGAAAFSYATPPSLEDSFYARRPDGSFIDIGPETPAEPGTSNTQGQGRLLGTPDLSHVIFSLNGIGLWPFDATFGENNSLYEYSGTGNSQPVQVGVSGAYENGENHSLISVCGTALGGDAQGAVTPNALSEDGATVFVTADECSASKGTPPPGSSTVPVNTLYARVDGGRLEHEQGLQAHTVLISGRSPSECTLACQSSAPQAAEMVGASTDGSKVVFLDTQQLTDRATQGAGSATNCAYAESDCNLYEYENVTAADPATEGHLIDVSAGDTSGLGPRVQGVMAVSADGSHVYFLANSVLAPGAAPGDCDQANVTGACNLYLYQRDPAYPNGHLAFVTTVPALDQWEWGLQSHLANVTPEGRFLVFASRGDLAPDDTSGPGALQLFRYDAGSGGAGSLTRISIGNRGYDDNGNRAAGKCLSATFLVGGTRCPEDANIVVAVFDTGEYRSDPTMSDDGSRVFFESPLALAPHALDDVQIGVEQYGQPVYARNVYEWEQEKVGSCPEGQSTGCVYLISDGHDTGDGISGACGNTSTCLIGSDTSGDNVFFTSSDQLVGQDTDGGQVNIWDARVGGGFSAPAVEAPCEECKGPSAPPPTFATPASATFTGPGNPVSAVSPPPKKVMKKTNGCKRGFVKKKVKKKQQCVKVKTKKRAKKSSHTDRRPKS